MRLLYLVTALLVSNAIATPLSHSTFAADKKKPAKSSDVDSSDSSNNAPQESKTKKLIGSLKNIKDGSGSKIRQAIRGLDKDVVALGARIQAWDGDSFAALDLLKAADQVNDNIKAGTALANSLPPITFFDGIAILPLFSSFTPHIKATMAILASKRAVFEKAEVTSVVLDKLKAIVVSGSDFDNAVVSKLGLISKPFGKAVYHPIDKAIKGSIQNLTAPPPAANATLATSDPAAAVPEGPGAIGLVSAAPAAEPAAEPDEMAVMDGMA